MLFVTGRGTLIALYASEYMEPDVGKGYARFFAGISVFLFAMYIQYVYFQLVSHKDLFEGGDEEEVSRTIIAEAWAALV